MGKSIKETDLYIAKSADFAQPILTHFRNIVHLVCPDAEEKIKWGMPHFDYKNQPLCYMASFKKHCAFGFWKASIMKDPALMEKARSEEAMGNLGKVSSLKELPPDKKIKAWIIEAMLLNDKGIKLPSKSKSTVQTAPDIPDYFFRELKKNKKALTFFNVLSPSQKKEYTIWITGAKTDITRDKRMATALAWLSEEKKFNWRYEKK